MYAHNSLSVASWSITQQYIKNNTQKTTTTTVCRLMIYHPTICRFMIYYTPVCRSLRDLLHNNLSVASCSITQQFVCRFMVNYATGLWLHGFSTQQFICGFMVCYTTIYLSFHNIIITQRFVCHFMVFLHNSLSVASWPVTQQFTCRFII